MRASPTGALEPRPRPMTERYRHLGLACGFAVGLVLDLGCGADRGPSHEQARLRPPATSSSASPAPSGSADAVSTTAAPAPAVSGSAAQARSRPVLSGRLAPPTAADSAWPCRAGQPIPIGTSDAPTWRGPAIAVAATRAGVLAVYDHAFGVAESRPLDAMGSPVGPASPVELGGDPGGWGTRLELWDLGEAGYVLAFAGGDDLSLQRLNPDGTVNGARERTRSSFVRSSAYTDTELVLALDAEPWMTRLALGAHGLETTSIQLPGSGFQHPRIMLTPDGQVRVVGGSGADNWTAREDGSRLRIKCEDCRNEEAQLDAEGRVIWRIHEPLPENGKILVWREAEGVPDRAEAGPEVYQSLRRPWRFDADFHWSDGKYHGLQFSLDDPDWRRKGTLMASTRDVSLWKQTRLNWEYDGAWTGAAFLAIYARGRSGAWEVVVQSVQCQGPAPAPGAAPSAQP